MADEAPSRAFYPPLPLGETAGGEQHKLNAGSCRTAMFLAMSVPVVAWGECARAHCASFAQIICTSPGRARDEKAGEGDRSLDNL